MSKKEIISREEFERRRGKWANDFDADLELRQRALEVFVQADKHNWIHQTNWLGEPCLQTPEDLITFQEIVFQTRPRFIIEVGVAWAGSLLFHGSMMQLLGGSKVIGIDIFIPDDLKERIYRHDVSQRIELIDAASTESTTVEKVTALLGDSKEVMVHLDSNHTCNHVLEELHLYSPLVGKGQYLICGDTIIEQIPSQTHRLRPWGPGNNPQTALNIFLKEQNRFEVDRQFDKKRLLVNQPGGFLRCICD